MARLSDEDVYRVCYIPGDYKNGTHILVRTYTLPWLIQGIILGLLPAALNYIILPSAGINIPFEVKTILSIVFGFILASIGINGINDESPGSFLLTYLRFRKNKRTTYYNPRVKKEMKPSLEEVRSANEMLPRDKAIIFYKRYKEEYDKKQREKVMQEQTRIGSSDISRMYFLDDEGIIDKPVEFMTDAEYKRYQKTKAKARRRKAEAQKNVLKNTERRRNIFAKGKTPAGNTGKVKDL